MPPELLPLIAELEAAATICSTRASAQAERARTLIADLAEAARPRLEDLDLPGITRYTVALQGDRWSCELEYDRCTFTGQGDSPEAALIEAWVDVQISNHCYAAAWDAPPLPLSTMTEWLHAAYREHLQQDVDHGYRGDYHPSHRGEGVAQ